MNKDKLTYNLLSKQNIAKLLAKIDILNDKNGLFGVDGGLVSSKQYYEIMQLYLFLKDNPYLSETQVYEILIHKKRFGFLVKLYHKFPNFINELKFNGPKDIAVKFAKLKQSKQNLL